jgi:Flp pilus assembly protein TadD
MRRPADQPITLDVAREVCQRMKGRAIVSASLAPRGDGYGLLLDAFECDSGNRIRAAGHGDTGTRRSRGEDRRGRGGAAGLAGRAGRVDRQVQRSPRHGAHGAIEPLQAFALGAKARGAVGDEAALPFFQRATDLDTEFALAWSRLGVVGASTGRVGLSRRAAARAYDLRARATEYDRLYITWNHAARVLHDDAATRAALTALASAYPRDFAARNNLGVYYVGHGEFEQALAEYRAAAALAPDEPVPSINIAYTLIFLRQRDEAYQTLSQVLRTRPDIGVGITRWLSAAIAGDPRAADFERRPRRSRRPRSSLWRGHRSHCGAAD